LKTVYEASNAIEAHMILDLLQQEGLSAQIQGEHLLGAIGELPGAGLVRVIVDDAEFKQARAAVERWDAAQPNEPILKPIAHKSNALRGFLLGLLIGIACSYAYFRSPIHVDGIDHNGDGILDERWTYAPSDKLLKSEIDRNLDGKIDYIVRHGRNGVAETAEADDNFDGVFESRSGLHASNMELSETDTDGDGYRDLRWHYINGVLSTAEYMNPSTFHPLRVEYYALGKLNKAEVDSDKDGKLDTRYTYNPLGEISAAEKMPK